MKQSIMLILSIFFSKILLAQENDFLIEGVAKNFPDKTFVRLRDIENNKWIDSVYIINEKFSIKASQPKYCHASQYFLFIDNQNEVIPILIENKEILKLEFDKTDFPKHSTLISKNQKVYENLDSIFYKPYIEITKYGFLIDIFKKQNSDEAINNVKQYEKLINIKRNEVNSSILNHKGNFVALHYLANYINVLQPDKQILIDFLNSLDQIDRSSKYAKLIEYYIDQEKEKEYLNDEMFDLNDKKIKLSDISYKNYILLDIASNYCEYSFKAKDDLENIVKNYSEELDVISIHIDNDKEGLKKYSTNKYSNWKFYYHPEGRFSEFFVKYKVIGTPAYYLFDKNRNIISSWKNDVNLKEQISNLIK